MSAFDYKTAPLNDALRRYLKDMPDLGYNGQYLIREALADIERLTVELQVFVTAYDDWLGRQTGKPSIDLAENARRLLQGGK